MIHISAFQRTRVEDTALMTVAERSQTHYNAVKRRKEARLMSQPETRKWGDEAAEAYVAGDRKTLDYLVEKATKSGDTVAVLICRAWRGDLGDIQKEGEQCLSTTLK